MTTLEYLEKMKRVRSQIEYEVDAILERNKEEIIDLNREEQIFNKRINIFGESLPTYFKNNKKGTTRGYPKIKNKAFNLFDTGELYNSFGLVSNGMKSQFLITNNDPKAEEVINKAGHFLGLTKGNLEIVNYAIMLPELQQFLKENL